MLRVTMKVLVVRHGEAEDGPEVQDKDRKLVKKGVKQMRRVGDFLSDFNLVPDKVVSSPYLRAYQSADVILDQMELDLKIETEDFLLPNSDPSLTIQYLLNNGSSVMLVGHNPHLESVIKLMTGGEISLKKGGVAFIELNRETGKGTLELLLDQKTLKLV